MGLRIIPTARYWSVHTHSRYSVNDALPSVEAIVDRAVELGQQAVGLTDHGNMAGSVQLYRACQKAGIKPFPGSEFYFVPDTGQHKVDYASKYKKASRYHLGIVAYTTEGYENLVRLSTLSHQNHFHKPLIDYTMLAQLAEDNHLRGLAVTTGCYFGYTAQTLITQGSQPAIQWLHTLDRWFPGSVYVEIQNHNIDHGDGWNDDLLADALVGLADEVGLPVVCTQDSHYAVESDRGDHETLKRLVAFGPDPDDAVFPGDGFHLADDSWIGDHHRGDRLERSLEGLGDLLSRHDLTIPVLDSYSYSVPRVVADPQLAMEARCLTRLDELSLPLTYRAKLQEEFEVIKAADMAGYMMLVAMVTDWMQEHDVVYQTRGSAAGSMVCWLLGISNLDPMKWDLRFERFLSKDRTKPPDIDLDVAHDRRDELIEFLDSRFTAHQIGSWAHYELDDTTDETGETQKGSLKVRYFTVQHKLEDGVTDWSAAPVEDKTTLQRLAKRRLYRGMGTNAAGVVITSSKAEFDKLVPLAYMASRKGYVSQYAKDDIEALGFVKLDVLGSKTLTVLRQTLANLGWTQQDLERISFNDADTYKLFKKGDTDGVFQLEGNSSKWGCRDLKPSSIKDVIAAMALFRPAAMRSGGTRAFVNRKHRREPVPERHQIISKVTKDTYGVVLYQEQVIDILRALGMDADNLTKFLKAVKASNAAIGKAAEVIAGYQSWIDQRCTEEGMNGPDRKFLNEAIAGFAEYGFNRAHASVYGITAYRCGYLSANHPLEFHAALLSVAAGGDKEKKYVVTTKKRGIRILAPEINVSGSSYTVDKRQHAIRRGLVSINGIGLKIAEKVAELAPYEDLDDLVRRVPPRPVSGGKNYDGTPESLEGALGHLYESGTLDVLIATKILNLSKESHGEVLRGDGAGGEDLDQVREETSGEAPSTD